MSTLVTRPLDAALVASSEAVIAKKILVLGATSGIAEATCRIWAAQGAQLFLVARNAEKLAAVAADLKLRGASYVGTAVADLDDTDKHAELLTHAVNSLTGMDIAYLAHGILGDQARGYGSGFLGGGGLLGRDERGQSGQEEGGGGEQVGTHAEKDSKAV